MVRMKLTPRAGRRRGSQLGTLKECTSLTRNREVGSTAEGTEGGREVAGVVTHPAVGAGVGPSMSSWEADSHSGGKAPTKSFIKGG